MHFLVEDDTATIDMQDKLRLKLPPENALVSANREDPIRYYYKPFLGRLYRQRINLGLSLLTYPVENVLDVGCGSGILAPTLIDACQHYTGIDIELPEASPYLARFSERANFRQMDICKTDFPDNFFDAIMIFSILEHIPDLKSALYEIMRVLKPGGQCISGFPMVNFFMHYCFRLAGFREAEECHVNNPSRILKAISSVLKVKQIRTMPLWAYRSFALYTCVKATKPCAY